jgi:hypothetical protein
MNLPILDVAIGICFIYLLLGLICTTVNEMISGWLKTRAKFLEQGIGRLLGNDALKRALYDHPLIRTLAAKDGARLPSYIPAERFVTALTDVLTGPGKSPSDLAALKQGLAAAGNEQLNSAVTALLDRPGMDAAAARARLEKWFDDGMERVTGWYKRNAQRNALILACVITVVLNADTVNIARTLWTSPTVRAAMVEEAKVRSEKARPEEMLPTVEYPNPQDPTASVPVNVPKQALTDKEQALLGQVTGWTDDQLPQGGSFFGWLWRTLRSHLLGWILTAIAVSLGAPFWFDTLSRFINIRNAGRVPEKGSQTPPPAPAASGVS